MLNLHDSFINFFFEQMNYPNGGLTQWKLKHALGVSNAKVVIVGSINEKQYLQIQWRPTQN